LNENEELLIRLQLKKPVQTDLSKLRERSQ